MLAVALPVLVYAAVREFDNKKGSLPVLVKESAAVQFELTDAAGKKATEARWKNKIVVANFFFTHCPVICPKMTRELNKVQQQYYGDPNIVISSFSVDPVNDSPAVLKRYVERFGATGDNRQFLTGDKKQIYRLARNAFMLTATDGDGGPGDFIHSDKLVLLDTKKRVRGYYNGTVPAETDQLIADIKKLENE